MKENLENTSTVWLDRRVTWHRKQKAFPNLPCHNPLQESLPDIFIQPSRKSLLPPLNFPRQIFIVWLPIATTACSGIITGTSNIIRGVSKPPTRGAHLHPCEANRRSRRDLLVAFLSRAERSLDYFAISWPFFEKYIELQRSSCHVCGFEGQRIRQKWQSWSLWISTEIPEFQKWGGPCQVALV